MWMKVEAQVVYRIPLWETIVILDCDAQESADEVKWSMSIRTSFARLLLHL